MSVKTSAGSGTAALIAAVFAVSLAAVTVRGEANFRYIAVDLVPKPSDGRCLVQTFDDIPAGGWTDEYKTGKMVLRLVPAGTFRMGMSAKEKGGEYFGKVETPHDVTVAKPFCIGVFEVTQKQWQHVMGGRSPAMFKGETLPVEQVSYDNIRGADIGSRWPAADGVDGDSFLGRLRKKTSIRFDLPTEAQWEYACRAGTVTALGTGRNLSSAKECPEMAEAGWYGFNPGKNGDGTAKVGSFLPNAWGLYDMHGNVAEWCLDWWQGDLGAVAQTDPKGPETGTWRAIRGGCWDGLVHLGHAAACRSAARGSYDCMTCANPMNASMYWGFRVVCPADIVVMEGR